MSSPASLLPRVNVPLAYACVEWLISTSNGGLWYFALNLSLLLAGGLEWYTTLSYPASESPKSYFSKYFKIAKLRNIFGLAFKIFLNISLGSVNIKCVTSILGNLNPDQVLTGCRSHQLNLTPSGRLVEGQEGHLQWQQVTPSGWRGWGHTTSSLGVSLLGTESTALAACRKRPIRTRRGSFSDIIFIPKM